MINMQKGASIEDHQNFHHLQTSWQWAIDLTNSIIGSEFQVLSLLFYSIYNEDDVSFKFGVRDLVI